MIQMSFSQSVSTQPQPSTQH